MRCVGGDVVSKRLNKAGACKAKSVWQRGFFRLVADRFRETKNANLDNEPTTLARVVLAMTGKQAPALIEFQRGGGAESRRSAGPTERGITPSGYPGQSSRVSQDWSRGSVRPASPFSMERSGVEVADTQQQGDSMSVAVKLDKAVPASLGTTPEQRNMAPRKPRVAHRPTFLHFLAHMLAWVGILLAIYYGVYVQ